MSHYISLAVLFCIIVIKSATLPLNSSFQIAPEIYLRPVEEGAESSVLGVVNGVRSCGGHGYLVQFRYEPCSPHDSSNEAPCQVPGDGQVRQSELEFIPSRDVGAVGIEFLVISDGRITTAFDKRLDEQDTGGIGLMGGERYVVSAMLGANPQLKGKAVKIQYMVYRVEDDNLEVCAEADLIILSDN